MKGKKISFKILLSLLVCFILLMQTSIPMLSNISFGATATGLAAGEYIVQQKDGEAGVIYKIGTVNGVKGIIVTGYAPSNPGVVQSKVSKKITLDGFSNDATGKQNMDIISIADNAFAGKNITSITIPATVRTIGTKAFANCADLTTVTLKGVGTQLGNYAFYKCSKLNKIEWSVGSNLSVIPEGCFMDSGIQYMVPGSGASATAFELPATVTTIGKYAFKGCSNLGKVKLPTNSKLSTIEESAFENCTKLTSCTVDSNYNAFKLNSVSHLSASIFKNTNLTGAVFLNSNVQNIPSYMFYGTKVSSVSHYGTGEFAVGDYAFSHCTSLQRIYGTINKIGARSFEYTNTPQIAISPNATVNSSALEYSAVKVYGQTNKVASNASFTQDKTAPNVTVTYKDSSGKTYSNPSDIKGAIIVTVKSNSTNFNDLLKPKAGWIIGDGWTTLTKTYTTAIDENETFYDFAENAVKPLKAYKADTTRPTYSVSEVESPGLTIMNITASDEDSGVAKIEVKRLGTNETYSSQTNTLSVNVTQSGMYGITVTDKAGNQYYNTYTVSVTPVEVQDTTKPTVVVNDTGYINDLTETSSSDTNVSSATVEKKKKIYVTAYDANKIDNMILKKDSGEEVSNYNPTIKVNRERVWFDITESGDYKIYVSDTKGNTYVSGKFTVNIQTEPEDADGPIVIVNDTGFVSAESSKTEVSPDAVQNSKKIYIIAYDESGLGGWILHKVNGNAEDKAGYFSGNNGGPQEITTSGDYYVTVTDLKGNETRSDTFTVNIINTTESQDGKYTYTLDSNNNVTIIKYNGTEEVVNVPTTIDGKPVTRIGAEAYKDNTNIRKVYIPDTITYIEENAFEGCTNLEEAIFAGSPTLEQNALPTNGKLTIYSDENSKAKDYADTYAINSGLYIKNGDFEYIIKNYEFTTLETNGVDSETNTKTETETVAEIIKYNGNDVNLVIPSKVGDYKVSSIGEESFKGNTTLQTVNCPGNIRIIEDNAFEGCSNLKKVVINNKTTTEITGNPFRNVNSDFKLYARLGSEAITWAKQNNIKYAYLYDGFIWEYDSADTHKVNIIGSYVSDETPTNVIIDERAGNGDYTIGTIKPEAFANTKIENLKILNKDLKMPDNYKVDPESLLTIYNNATSKGATLYIYKNSNIDNYLSKPLTETVDTSKLANLVNNDIAKVALQKMGIDASNLASASASLATKTLKDFINVEYLDGDSGDINIKTIVPKEANMSLYVGQTDLIVTDVTPTVAAKQGLNYTSSDTSVVTVDENGEIKGIKAGTATIQISAKDNSGVSTSVNVTVSYINIPLNLDGGSVLYNGKTYTDSDKPQAPVVYKAKISSIPTPTKTGYTFEGWYTTGTDDDGNTVAGDILEGDTEITKPITLNAKWKKVDNNNGGDNNGGDNNGGDNNGGNSNSGSNNEGSNNGGNNNEGSNNGGNNNGGSSNSGSSSTAGDNSVAPTSTLAKTDSLSGSKIPYTGARVFSVAGLLGLIAFAIQAKRKMDE